MLDRGYARHGPRLRLVATDRIGEDVVGWPTFPREALLERWLREGLPALYVARRGVDRLTAHGSDRDWRIGWFFFGIRRHSFNGVALAVIPASSAVTDAQIGW